MVNFAEIMKLAGLAGIGSKAESEPLILSKQQKLKMLRESNDLRRLFNKTLQKNPEDSGAAQGLELIDKLEAAIMSARES